MENDQNTPNTPKAYLKNRRRRTDRIATRLQGITAICAVIALGISLITFQRQLNLKASKTEVALIQKQRYESAIDACTILKKVVYAAFGPKYKKQATELTFRVGIQDCLAYASQTVQPVQTRGS